MKANILSGLFGRKEKDNALESLKSRNELLELQVARMQSQNFVKITERQQFLYKKDLQAWQLAHQDAISVYRPRRQQLIEVYEDAMLDAFLSGKIQTRVLNVLNTPFKIVNEKLDKQDAESNRLNKRWFFDLLKEICLSFFYGYSVLEFYFDKNGLVQSTKLFPRENCLPDCDSLLPDVYGETLVSIANNPNYLRVYQNDLGLLLKAAPFTILKRHAKAFWSRFQELFGVPFRHAKYSGNDSRIIDTLYENLKEMGSAAFGVFPQGAEIGFLENSKSDAYSVFLEAIKQANEEISQLVLGVPANQDASGSFARDKVSYEKEGDIGYSDLRFVAFVINDQLLPLLNQWGYNFEGLQFVFDPSWKLPLATTQLEIDTWIAQNYEIEESYIAETYGVPVKKKPLARQDKTAVFVGLEDLHPYLYQNFTEITALAFDKDWAKDDYKPLFDYYTAEFTKAVNKGWQQDLDNAIFIKLHQNAYEFAGAKYLTLKKEIAAGKSDKDVFERHERYLSVEKQHFTASSQMASKWRTFEKNKDKLPYLQWVTAQDEAVRVSHAKLNGIIKAVGDAWWDTHPVPLGYRCRCTIRQLSKFAAEKDPNFGKEAPEIEADSPLFQNNAGKTGVAFNNKHPYFEGMSKDLRNALKEYGGYGEEYVKQGFDFENNSYTVSHTTHGKNELKDNLNVAKILNKEKIKVVLLPLNDNEALFKIIPANQRKEGKFTDAWLPDLGVVMDFKTVKNITFSAIDSAIRSGKSQANYILLDIKAGSSYGILKNALQDRVSRSPNVKEVWIILENKFYKLSRKDILSNNYPF